RPRLSGRTQVFLLERAEVGRHRLLVRRGGSKEHAGFQVADEQDVAVLLEPATAAAGDADRAGGGDLAIDSLVEFQNMAAEFCGHWSISRTRTCTGSPGPRPASARSRFWQRESHLASLRGLLARKWRDHRSAWLRRGSRSRPDALRRRTRRRCLRSIPWS